MKELTAQEQDIVHRYKEQQFGAFLQWVWLFYPEFAEKGERPSNENLGKILERLREVIWGFNFCYFHRLPRETVNPLLVEQEAWRKLSPLIKQHADKLGALLPRLVSGEGNLEGDLLAEIKHGWELFQKWNVISNSFRTKHDSNWNLVEEREEAVRNLVFEEESIPGKNP